MSFKQFLKTIKHLDSPEGDFACDFLNDSRSKGVTIRSHVNMHDFLLKMNACEEAKVSAYKCVTLWLRSK